MEGEVHPYERLTPECVLDAVEAAGFECDGRMLALNSYENRVYQVGLEDSTPVIAKFYRPGRWHPEAIIEEHEFATELADLEIPVVAPLMLEPFDATIGEHEGFSFAVYPRRPGRWPDLETRTDRELLGRFIGRMHACGGIRPFGERIRLNVETFGHLPLADLERCESVPSEIRSNVLTAARMLLEAVALRLDAYPCRNIRLHGDFHLGNVLWSDHGPHIVDLDDCCTGPAIQDLWMLLSGSRDERQGQLLDVLRGYEEFAYIDYSELTIIEALRGLRMVRYNGWLAARWEDPAFQKAFPWFTTPRYWEEQIVNLREQLELLDEPSLSVI